MAEVVSTNQFRNGMHIEIDGAVWRIVEFQHVKPGKGGAFVRTKLKSARARAPSSTRRSAPARSSPRVHTEVKNVQYLYDTGDEVVFMDEETYEQFGLPHADVADELAFLPPSSSVQMLAVDGKPSGIQLPASVELTVTETEPGVQRRHGLERDEAGDARDGRGRPGAALRRTSGERIKVDPREGRYISRDALTVARRAAAPRLRSRRAR